ncbi:hypothetical protein A2U01_0063132, partial [Trifolium medium]|nr:hypothetical protein [Trifolium medium]
MDEDVDGELADIENQGFKLRTASPDAAAILRMR